MITLIMLSIWIMAGLATYRRTGYMWENHLRNKGHEYQSICGACKCKNCDTAKQHHQRWSTDCTNFEWKSTPHPTNILLLLPGTLALWPGFVTFWAINAARQKLGIDGGSFFVPPPVVESKQEKAERLFAEREIESKAREAAIDARERELGVGRYAQ